MSKKVFSIIDKKMSEEMRKCISSDIIIDDVITSDSQLIVAPLEFAKGHSKPFYTNTRPQNYKDIYYQNGLGYLPLEMLSTEFAKKLMPIFILEKNVASFSYLFETVVETFKVTHQFQVGAFVDRLGERIASKAKNYLAIHRSVYHLFQLFSFFSNKTIFSPIDCEFAEIENTLIIQLQVRIDPKDVQVLKSILSKNESESNSFLTREYVLAVEDADFIDLSYVAKTGILYASCLYIKDSDTKLSGFRFSNTLNLKFNELKEVKLKYLKDDKSLSIIAPNQFALLTEKMDNLKESAPLKSSNEEIQSSFATARKLAFFIKSYLSRETIKPISEDLNDDAILFYLQYYPRPEVIEKLKNEEKELICILVREEKISNEASEAVAAYTSEILEKNEEVKKVISGKTIEDVAEIISINSNSKYEDEILKVKAWTESVPEGADEASYNSLQDDEKWHLKKNKLNTAIDDEILRIKSLGEKVTEDDYVRVISNTLGISEADAKYIVNGVVEEATGDMIVKRIEELREPFVKSKSVETVQQSMLIRDVKLEENLVKMKKIMDGMKQEILKLREEIKSKAQMSLSPGTDLSEQLVKIELEKLKESAANKDKMLKKFKDDIENVIKNKDRAIDELKEKLEKMKNDTSEHDALELKRKFDVATLENKTLKSKLDLAMKKIQIMNENIEKQTAEFSGKRDRDGDIARQSGDGSMALLQKTKDEKAKLESENLTLKEKLIRLEGEFHKGNGALNSQEVTKRDNLILNLTSEKKQLEDQVKDLIIDTKRLEQKMKILTVQNEELNKKRGGSAKNIDNVHKQLDLANQRNQEALIEITEKKKDIIKLKSENSMMQAKLQELERKIASLERSKAS